MAALESPVLDPEVFEEAQENGRDASKGQEAEEMGGGGEERRTRGIERNWGFSLEELYALALKFFKGNAHAHRQMCKCLERSEYIKVK